MTSNSRSRWMLPLLWVFVISLPVRSETNIAIIDGHSVEHEGKKYELVAFLWDHNTFLRYHLHHVGSDIVGGVLLLNGKRLDEWQPFSRKFSLNGASRSFSSFSWVCLEEVDPIKTVSGAINFSRLREDGTSPETDNLWKSKEKDAKEFNVDEIPRVRVFTYEDLYRAVGYDKIDFFANAKVVDDNPASPAVRLRSVCELQDGESELVGRLVVFRAVTSDTIKQGARENIAVTGADRFHDWRDEPLALSLGGQTYFSGSRRLVRPGASGKYALIRRSAAVPAGVRHYDASFLLPPGAKLVGQELRLYDPAPEWSKPPLITLRPTRADVTYKTKLTPRALIDEIQKPAAGDGATTTVVLSLNLIMGHLAIFPPEDIVGVRVGGVESPGRITVLPSGGVGGGPRLLARIPGAVNKNSPVHVKIKGLAPWIKCN